ncbi:amidohydrolase [Mongoliibacter ruber]|uniref:Cytosine/adenosine deaminase-related metal-dependent hydrolase n=1 Tax=Mongoliibacter ruber TaxID=1750599 RepID=A0A2T0WT25_9BACT|nr:amidohydrolase [Mongoliibacter ruber]PRY89830.1 cytosine/adenosine deaminase-related metal-dependent hydrolase [Mongoliibacter ruber]
MSNKQLNRRNFLSQTIALTGAGLLSPTFGFADSNSHRHPNHPLSKITFKNVKLETGFIRDEVEVIATETKLFLVVVENGKITEILPNNSAADAIDAQGYLMLPAMKDMHIHLDKTYYSGPWKARESKFRTVKELIEHEKEVIPTLLPHSTERAKKLVELLHSQGTDFARSHVNIEPTSKLDSLKNLQKALEAKEAGFGAELVAFPQHGVFYSGSQELMREAAGMGIDFIGGVDPYSIDGQIEKTMDFTVQLALDYHKGLDIHLHETGESGLKTVQYLIDKVNENPSLKGKTYLSHCFILGAVDSKTLEATCEALAEAQIGITTTVPIGYNVMPIPKLLEHGIPVMAGTDCVTDHWQPFGTGSMLDKAKTMAELYRYNHEFGLSRCLGIGTKGVTPLDNEGKQVWPKVGDEASFNLIAASCSAEAVARLSPVKQLYHKGNLVFESGGC